jgi:Glycosyltransferase family 87
LILPGDSDSSEWARARSAAGRLLRNPLVLVLLIALAAIRMVGLVASLPAHANRWDFSHYYVSALAMREGLDPYTADLTPLAARLELRIEEINRATYPPTFVLAFEPLTLLTPRAAYWTWFAMNVAALGAALWMLLGPGSGIDPPLALALGALALLYPPLWDHFDFAQSQILVLLLLVLMMRSLRRGDDGAAGLWLALAALLRVFPILMAGYLLARRRWRAIAYLGAGVATGAIVTVAMVGIGRCLSFRDAVAFVDSPLWLARSGNLSLAAFISRLFWYRHGIELTPTLEAARAVTSTGAELALFAVSVFATATADPSEERELAWFPLWVAAAIILSPTAWLHYLVMMYLPFAIFAAAAGTGRISRRAAWMAVACYAIPLAEVVAAATLISTLSPPAMLVLRETLILAPVTGFLAGYWYARDAASA